MYMYYRYLIVNQFELYSLQVDIPSEPEDDDEDPDGRFAFKRKRGVKYLPVSWLLLTRTY